MKKIYQPQVFILLALGLLAYSTVSGQSGNPEPSIHDLIQIRADAIYDSLVSIRRDIHQNPELSLNEVRTSKLVADYLLRLGLEVKTNIGGYGVVGILNGKTEGNTIAWRAEMDAYYTGMPDVVEFRSKVDSVRHICGHDVHTTIGLGIANVLTRLKDSINGTVVFIFQPAEESLAGARAMIDDGIYDIIKPDEIYGLHMDEIPAGTVALKSNALVAHLKFLTITYKNIENRDSVESYTESVLNKHSTLDSKLIRGKRVDHEIGIFSEGSIFKDFISFLGGFNVRENDQKITLETAFFGTDKEKLNSLPEKLTGVINKSAFANQFVSVTSLGYHEAYDIYNDPRLTEKARNTISTIYGQNSIKTMYGVVTGFGDDFAYFLQDIPGGYYILGGSNYEKGIISSPHTPDFAVDEKCISAGVKYFSSMIIERFKDE
jgi:metal-dependent amidase/aminoacylase/carboxypeptidase family protein